MRPIKVRIGKASFEAPGEFIPLLIGTLVLVGGKLAHVVLRLLHCQ